MIESLDLAVFRFFNATLASPWLDPVMKFLSGNVLFIPTLVVVLAALIGWGGRRGRIFVLLLGFVIVVGDPILVGKAKRLIGRDRPFVTHPETRLVAGRGSSYAMPSGHAAIWGAITAVTFLMYRRRWVPVAVIGFGVGISRMYLGVHYPTDVLAGWAVGTGYGVLLARMAAWIWSKVGGKWFPEWHRALPDLLSPDEGERALPVANAHWERLAFGLLALLLVVRWVYVAVPVIELSEDEAYQWVWSKRLALSYYSKPAGIAVAHWFGNLVGGDREFGVRFLPPLLGFLSGWMLLRFVTARTDGRTGFLLVLALQATPLLGVGSVLMTIDPLTVFFYTAGMLAAWRAVKEDSTGWWCVVGLTLAGSLLSKYFAPFQLAALVIAMAWIPSARQQWRRPGPWLALGILLLGTLPILVWNAQNDWVTFTHLGERGGLDQKWSFRSAYLIDFLAVVPVLLNPVWFVLVTLAVVAVLRDRRAPEIERFLVAFTVPVFVFYLLYTLRARVQPNWIAASLLPGFTLGALYWHRRWREGSRGMIPWLKTGLAIGLPLIILLHETNLVKKIAGQPLPVAMEPLRRVRGHREFALQVAQARTNLMSEGRPVFVIADHYGRTGLLSFYSPGGPESLPDHPFIYEIRTERARSQFYFWPGYQERRGENAVFVRRLPRDPDDPLPPTLKEDFESVDRIGVLDVKFRDRLFHQYELFACRGKR